MVGGGDEGRSESSRGPKGFETKRVEEGGGGIDTCLRKEGAERGAQRDGVEIGE